MTHKEGQAIIDKTVSQLAEHFDAVQIMASSLTEKGHTRTWKSGSGNYYARRGMCDEFIEQDIAQTTAREQKLSEDQDEEP